MSQCVASLAYDHYKWEVEKFVREWSEPAGFGLLPQPPPSTDEIVETARKILAGKDIKEQLGEKKLFLLELALDHLSSP